MQMRATASALSVVILIAIVRTPASAQSSTTASGVAQETQARGFWTDPSTGLMWAGKDNGKGVSWKKAVKYCGNLRLAGYSDWRLATLAELEMVYDRNVNAPGRAGQRDVGRPSGYDWYFDFGDGRSDNDPSGFPYPSSIQRALCVRQSGQ
jgi:hypothetical protein